MESNDNARMFKANAGLMRVVDACVRACVRGVVDYRHDN
jgi:hypothetical protein